MIVKYTEDQLRVVISKNLSIAGACRDLGIIASGGNYRTISRKIKKFNIDISHFTGKAWNVGARYRQINKSKPIEEYLKKDSPCSSSWLKIKLIRLGIKKHVCESCMNKEWLNELIPLELHHINGDSDDNRLENINLLCPNCHSLTDNYRGRNIRRVKQQHRSRD